MKYTYTDLCSSEQNLSPRDSVYVFLTIHLPLAGKLICSALRKWTAFVVLWKTQFFWNHRVYFALAASNGFRDFTPRRCEMETLIILLMSAATGLFAVMADLNSGSVFTDPLLTTVAATGAIVVLSLTKRRFGWELYVSGDKTSSPYLLRISAFVGIFKEIV